MKQRKSGFIRRFMVKSGCSRVASVGADRAIATGKRFFKTGNGRSGILEIEKSATRMIAFCEARFFDLRKWKMKNGK